MAPGDPRAEDNIKFDRRPNRSSGTARFQIKRPIVQNNNEAIPIAKQLVATAD